MSVRLEAIDALETHFGETHATLPADLRTHLTNSSRTTRRAQPPLGLWPRSTADPDGAAVVAHREGLQQLVIWPKLFRRVAHLSAGFTDFNAFDTWLRADPVNRDDELFLPDTLERGNMHDVGNGGDTALLQKPRGDIIDRRAYTADQVRTGRTI